MSRTAFLYVAKYFLYSGVSLMGRSKLIGGPKAPLWLQESHMACLARAKTKS